MLFDKRFSLKTVYYRSFLLLIVIPILLVSVISLTLTRYIMERSAITNIRNAQASIESSLSKAIRDISLQLYRRGGAVRIVRIRRAGHCT